MPLVYGIIITFYLMTEVLQERKGSKHKLTLPTARCRPNAVQIYTTFEPSDEGLLLTFEVNVPSLTSHDRSKPFIILILPHFI